MKAQSKLNAWLPALTLALSAAVAAPAAQAQNGSYDRGTNRVQVPAAPRVEFQYRPQWVPVTRTNVLMVRSTERPNYDMFSYGSNYYIYNNGYWYSSSRWDGSYVAIDPRDVPTTLHDVPQAEWRSYPSTWAYDNNPNNNSNNYPNNNPNNYPNNAPNVSYDGRVQDNGYYDLTSAPQPPQVYFSHNPRWVNVSGTRVLMLSARDRLDYDMFRYGSSVYIYDNGYWYRSNRPNGRFVAIDARAVPSVFYQVPASQWRNYPPSWRTTRSYNSSYYRQSRNVRTRNR